MKRSTTTLLAAAVSLLGLTLDPGARSQAGEFIVIQSTTSTQNSGLLDAIAPAFTAETGIEARVVAVGTGQALRNARNGDGDVLLVHSKPDELAFVEAGFGRARYDIMYNDFVVVGPASDPAAIRGSQDAPAALAKIASSKAVFASRADDSGTHKKEQALWRISGLEPGAGDSTWYRETGSGMGATLNYAAGAGAYTLTNRATWIAFKNKSDLVIMVSGDERLYNQYGVIVVDPERHPHVKAQAGQRFVDWLRGEAGQSAIAAFRVGGEQLFFPNAGN